jgi:hypothetical protein
MFERLRQVLEMGLEPPSESQIEDKVGEVVQQLHKSEAESICRKHEI